MRVNFVHDDAGNQSRYRMSPFTYIIKTFGVRKTLTKRAECHNAPHVRCPFLTS